ncbi:hypothetical protein G436_3926 [Leptospira interrogans serovar Hardjo str. Norma]|uniref:Uncharacterized protein n=1 Tax=Leptospira interrogans serovar Hardjo str. Norma TaxID=1279460 RepID=A0A0M4NBI7_LEPIR|nr:hypothetical protein G436_3926 [Leptospira interrogans serovar Hardjo str. Norma]
MWELPQITILQTNPRNVGTHTFRKFFLYFLTLNPPNNSFRMSFHIFVK